MTATRSESQLSIDFERRVIHAPALRIVGMVRGSDPIESQGAAQKAVKHQTRLQQAILHLLATEGPATAKEIESRADMRSYGPSTVRRRFSELKELKLIRQVEVDGVGQRRDGCAVFDIAVPCETD